MDQRTELAALRIAANKLLQACDVVPNGSLSAEFVRETFKDSLPEAATLTQQQGGEQEGPTWNVRGPNGRTMEQALAVLLDQASRVEAFGLNGTAANLREAHEDITALRSKQPAASEGDGQVKCLMCGAPCVETSREMLGEDMQPEVVKGCRYTPPRHPADEGRDALLDAVLDWWHAHMFDTYSCGDDAGEANAYDEPPEFVRIALAALAPAP